MKLFAALFLFAPLLWPAPSSATLREACEPVSKDAPEVTCGSAQDRSKCEQSCGKAKKAYQKAKKSCASAASSDDAAQSSGTSASSGDASSSTGTQDDQQSSNAASMCSGASTQASRQGIGQGALSPLQDCEEKAKQCQQDGGASADKLVDACRTARSKVVAENAARGAESSQMGRRCNQSSSNGSNLGSLPSWSTNSSTDGSTSTSPSVASATDSTVSSQTAASVGTETSTATSTGISGLGSSTATAGSVSFGESRAPDSVTLADTTREVSSSPSSPSVGGAGSGTASPGAAPIGSAGAGGSPATGNTGSAASGGGSLPASMSGRLSAPALVAASGSAQEPEATQDPFASHDPSASSGSGGESRSGGGLTSPVFRSQPSATAAAASVFTDGGDGRLAVNAPEAAQASDPGEDAPNLFSRVSERYAALKRLGRL